MLCVKGVSSTQRKREGEVRRLAEQSLWYCRGTLEVAIGEAFVTVGLFEEGREPGMLNRSGYWQSLLPVFVGHIC